MGILAFNYKKKNPKNFIQTAITCLPWNFLEFF